MVEMFNSESYWLKYVITGDETWVYGYDPETKRQSSQWLEPGELRFKKARMIKSKLKCLLITFFDVKGLVHYEFIPRLSLTCYPSLISAFKDIMAMLVAFLLVVIASLGTSMPIRWSPVPPPPSRQEVEGPLVELQDRPELILTVVESIIAAGLAIGVYYQARRRRGRRPEDSPC
ncbi:hypothetical protein LAZ67_12002445 [Cordylochernes scorpioides]|uniref:Uncharacterized protein n=1 Tax=Cordylochernes scorpioides TaxID=51811 RepID=A0ABY6L1T8_9ARAC|nr:hypothetical protein LAZ67_12002445 [Cordylochernes scorpioides]